MKIIGSKFESRKDSTDLLMIIKRHHYLCNEIKWSEYEVTGSKFGGKRYIRYHDLMKRYIKI